MSNSSSSDLSSTIANMMDALNPSRARKKTELRSPLDFLPPLKRRLSSESIESPSDKRLKADSSFNSNFETSWLSSPRESRRMRAEIVELRSTIASLENRIRHQHGIRKELQVMFDNEIRSHQLQHERDRKSIESLEEQVQSIRKREKEVRDQLDGMKGGVDTDKVNYENKIQALEINISKLKSELKLMESEEREETSSLCNRIEDLEMIVNATKEDAEAQKKLVNELQARIAKLSAVERDNEIKDQALLKAQLKIKDLEYTLEGFGEWQAQAKQQQQKLSNYSELERELQKLREDNKHLRDEVQNKLILEEQVHDLRTRLEKFGEHAENLAKLQTSHSHLENLVEEFRLLVSECCDTKIFSDVTLTEQIRQHIDKLQQQEVALTSEKVKLEGHLKDSQHDVQSAKSELERVVKQVTDLQTAQSQHQSLIHRLQKKLSLVSRERDSYRQQIDTYEKDLTVSLVPGSHNNSQITALKERIECLEKTIEGYRDLINNLENDLLKQQPDEKIAPVRTEQLTLLQAQCEKLQHKNQRLTERNDELQIRLEQLLVGNDKVQGQVLHLKANPLAESIAEKESTEEKLLAEIENLKRKIRNLKEGLETSKLSESVSTSREVVTLRSEIKAADTKNKLLKEYFKTSLNELRECLYVLFGYKFTKLSETQYQLLSMYAEAPEDILQFHLDSQGNMNLLETSYSSSLEEMVELHLRQHRSIPVFLSTHTIDLFNRTTIMSS